MRRSYPEELKAEAMGRVLSGETVTAVAKSIGAPRITVEQWMQRGRLAVTENVTPTVKEKFGALLIEYAGAGLQTLRTQAELLGDTTFLRSETSQIFATAQAHRILGDQLARYLAALQPEV